MLIAWVIVGIFTDLAFAWPARRTSEDSATIKENQKANFLDNLWLIFNYNYVFSRHGRIRGYV